MEKTEINGKIYTIRSPHTDKYYIGSTTQKYLSDRMRKHRHISNVCTSKQIIELGDAYIELLELYKCNSKEELKRREGELIREYKNNCINKFIAGRTPNQFRKEIIIKCDCGSEIPKADITKHNKTKKHLKFINQIAI